MTSDLVITLAGDDDIHVWPEQGAPACLLRTSCLTKAKITQLQSSLYVGYIVTGVVKAVTVVVTLQQYRTTT